MSFVGPLSCVAIKTKPPFLFIVISLKCCIICGESCKSQKAKALSFPLQYYPLKCTTYIKKCAFPTSVRLAFFFLMEPIPSTNIYRLRQNYIPSNSVANCLHSPIFYISEHTQFRTDLLSKIISSDFPSIKRQSVPCPFSLVWLVTCSGEYNMAEWIAYNSPSYSSWHIMCSLFFLRT